MCSNPILIRNKNYHSHFTTNNPFVNRDDLYIQVPCGHCKECRSLRQTYLNERVQMASLDYHPFMFTLTYKDDMIPQYIDDQTGVVFPVIDYSDVQNMFKRIRKELTNEGFSRYIKYICVPEYSPKKGRPHYHGIFFVQKFDKDTYSDVQALEDKFLKLFIKHWTRNLGTRKFPVYRPLCDYVRYVKGCKIRTTLDFHYVKPSSDPKNNTSVSYYVTKYFFKDNKFLNQIKAMLIETYRDENGICDLEKVNQLLKTYFKPTIYISKNLGGMFTEASYQAYRSDIRYGVSKLLKNELSSSDYLDLKECAAFFLEYNPKVVNKLEKDFKCSIVDFAAKNGRLGFYDIHTGKELPLSRYYRNRLPEHLLNEYRRLIVEKFDGHMPITFKDVDTDLLVRAQKNERFMDGIEFDDVLDE